MAVFTVFNIGTGHSRDESNTLMVRLYNAVQATDAHRVGGPNAGNLKMINDGIGKSYDEGTGKVSSNLLAQAVGWGLKDKTRDTVDEIIDAGPDKVNLCGHSRGAIISVRIAAKLFEKAPQIRCNLFPVDPVKRTFLGTDAYNAQTHGNVDMYRQILMEGEQHFIFNVQRITHHAGGSASVRMPGDHGSATQSGQPVGMVAYMLCTNWLRMAGSPMGDGPFTEPQLCDAYARITAANPARRVKNRTVRTFRDLDRGKRITVGQGRSKTFGRMGVTNEFEDHHYFVNENHAHLFAARWPNLFGVLTGKIPFDMRMQHQLRSESQRLRAAAPRSFNALPDAYKELTG